MKKFIAGILSTIMLFGVTAGFSGCNKSTNPDNPDESQGGTASASPNPDPSDSTDSLSTNEQVANNGDMPTLPVQLMTREANYWQGFYNSPTVEINGNGSYKATLSDVGYSTKFPMLIISAVGTTTTDAKKAGSAPAPAEYVNATITIDSLKFNGRSLTLTDCTNAPLVPDEGIMEGYANFQLWNAWWEPSQRIVSDGAFNLDYTAGENAPVLEFDRAV
ncbi:MAG: hypothetical protein FWF82_05090, partial [Oscillospiraceae bacterium]|nr:hypothetical protein [Oscillospiraceae bacterium]